MIFIHGDHSEALAVGTVQVGCEPYAASYEGERGKINHLASEWTTLACDLAGE
jgi:hypothetical protein